MKQVNWAALAFAIGAIVVAAYVASGGHNEWATLAIVFAVISLAASL